MPKLAPLKSLLEHMALNQSAPEHALRIAQVLGEVLWKNQDGIFSAEEFEDGLLRSTEARLLKNLSFASEPDYRYLHVATDAPPLASHTLLMRRIAVAQQEAGHAPRILCLHRGDAFDFEAFGIPREQVMVPSASSPGRDSLITRARTILTVAGRAQTLVLHIHPNDIGAALAGRLARRFGRRVLFVNHADHVFSYGTGAANAVLEISGWGWRLTEAERAHQAQHFIGLAAGTREESPTLAAGPARLDGPILSMGRADRYRPAPGNDFPAFLGDLLTRVPNSADLIGPTGAEPWWQPLRAAHADRVRFHGMLAPAEANPVIARASCYVDSFPQSGSTTLLRAFLDGKTVFAPNRGSAGGYSPVELLRSETVAGMTDEIAAYLTGGPGREVDEDALRQRLLHDFSARAVAERLEAAERGDYAPPPDDLLNCPRPLDYFTRGGRGRRLFLDPLETLVLSSGNAERLRRIVLALGDPK